MSEIRCARVDQTGDLDAELQVPVTLTMRQALERAAFELRQDTGTPYSAPDLAREAIRQWLAAREAAN